MSFSYTVQRPGFYGQSTYSNPMTKSFVGMVLIREGHQVPPRITHFVHERDLPKPHRIVFPGMFTGSVDGFKHTVIRVDEQMRIFDMFQR